VLVKRQARTIALRGLTISLQLWIHITHTTLLTYLSTDMMIATRRTTNAVPMAMTMAGQNPGNRSSSRTKALHCQHDDLVHEGYLAGRRRENHARKSRSRTWERIRSDRGASEWRSGKSPRGAAHDVNGTRSWPSVTLPSTRAKQPRPTLSKNIWKLVCGMMTTTIETYVSEICERC